MNHTKITLLNTSILTSYGEFRYTPLAPDEARRLIDAAGEVRSAIGHASTAAMLSELLDYPVYQNRMEYRQQSGEAALVFKLKGRPPDGKILNRSQMEAIGYEFGLLRKLK